MSADNGYIIRKTEEETFTLQMYFASDPEYPPIEDAGEEETFNTLLEAALAYEHLSEDPMFICEYGLMNDTSVPTKSNG